MHTAVAYAETVFLRFPEQHTAISPHFSVLPARRLYFKCTGKKERVPSLTAAVRECMLTGVNRAAVFCASMFSLRPEVSATGMVGSNTRRSRRPVAGAPRQPAASFRGHRCPRPAQFARTQDMPSRGCPAGNAAD